MSVSMSDHLSSFLHSALARVGHAVFPRRLWVGLAVVAVVALFVRPHSVFGSYQAMGIVASLGLILFGLAGRAWAAGCAGQHTRDARIAAPRLTTGGPYAYVRNPIYLASIILGFGMVGLVGDPILLLIHLAVCLLLYAGIIPAEEQFLADRFGTEYSEYRENVPRLWPRLRPWEKAAPVSFDPRTWLDQFRLALVLAGIYFGLHLAAWLRS
jgi:protein-S-isoprenylcysteine O-methyltransferase Ste14